MPVALDGNGSSVPTLATPSVINERQPSRNRTTTSVQATIVERGAPARNEAAMLRPAEPTAASPSARAARPRKKADSASAPVDLERADLRVGDEAGGAVGPALGPDVGQARQVPGPGPDLGGGDVGATGDEGGNGEHHREQEVLGQDPQQV